MCWRRISKFQKTVILVLFYAFILSVVREDRLVYNFVKQDVRIGDKYVLIYLVSKTPVFSDFEGSNVFVKRQCGNCFITNNKGFLPQFEYDAVLVHGSSKQLGDSLAFIDPHKQYLMETKRRCLYRKLIGCGDEPVITSFATRKVYNLRSLCNYLHKKRKMETEKG